MIHPQSIGINQMAIRRRVMQFEVFYDDNINSFDEVEGMSLEDLIQDADEEHMVGMASFVSDDEVPADKVKENLIRIGNDGDFFNDEY